MGNAKKVVRRRRSEEQELEEAATELVGGEITESDLDSITSENIRGLVVMPTDWTIAVLVDLLQKKKIELQPDFQRRVAWDDGKMSRYLESLFLGLPVPQVVLAETKPGRYVVIDGKQRLTALSRFCIPDVSYPPLKLQGCDYKTELNGKTYEQLESDESLSDELDAFLGHTTRTIVIKHWASEEVIYLLFLRLNQNSVKLSPQELRRALHPGPFYTWLDERTARSTALEAILTKVPDFRMRDMELCIRFFAFAKYSENYSGNMKAFLDYTSQQFSKNWTSMSSECESLMARYERAIDTTKSIFGTNAFKVFADGEYQSVPNRAVIDIMCYFFSYPAVRKAALANKKKVATTFERLCTTDPEFLRFLQSTTKSKQATSGRFGAWRRELARALSLKLVDPKIPAE